VNKKIQRPLVQFQTTRSVQKQPLLKEGSNIDLTFTSLLVTPPLKNVRRRRFRKTARKKVNYVWTLYSFYSMFK